VGDGWLDDCCVAWREEAGALEDRPSLEPLLALRSDCTNLRRSSFIAHRSHEPEASQQQESKRPTLEQTIAARKHCQSHKFLARKKRNLGKSPPNKANTQSAADDRDKQEILTPNHTTHLLGLFARERSNTNS
jgi:hypothetical protein